MIHVHNHHLCKKLIRWLLYQFTHSFGKRAEKHNARFDKFLVNTLHDYRHVLANFNLLKFLVGGLFAYGVIITYSVMTPFLVQTELGTSNVVYGWLALLVSVPHYCSASYNRHLVLKIGVEKTFSFGIIFITGAGIIMAFLSVFGIMNLGSIIFPMMVAAIGQSLIFSNTVSSALHDFPPYLVGKASAIFSSLQMLLISLLSAIVAILPNKTTLPLSLVLITLGVLSGSVLKIFKKPKT